MRRKLGLHLLPIIVATFGFAFLFSGCSSENTNIPQNSDYAIIFTDMIKQDGGIYYINELGEIEGKITKLNMQDLSCFDISDSKIALSGCRKNNTLIFHRGNATFDTDFVFLNDTSYSGLTSVKLRDDSIIGIMNGNFQNGTYLNLYVLQTLSGEVIHQKPLEIYSHAVIDSGPETLVFGTFMSSQEKEQFLCAEIISYDNKEAHQYKYEQYNCIWNAIEHDNSYICLVENKSEIINTVVSINSKSFEIENELFIDDQLSTIFEYEKRIYAIGDRGLYLVDMNSEVSTLVIDFAQSSKQQGDDYANFAYVIGNEAYVFLRNTERQEYQGSFYYGSIIKLSLETLEYTRTEVTYPGNRSLDNIFIVPCSFLRTE